jgi:hypothetical protein
MAHEEITIAKQRAAGRPRVVEFQYPVDKNKRKKKRGVVKPLAPTPITRDVYLDVANLDSPGAIKKFLEKYPLFAVYDSTLNAGKPVANQDIEIFKSVVRKHTTGAPLTSEESSFFQEQLSGCYPSLVSPAYVNRELTRSEEKDLAAQLERMRDRYRNRKQSLAGAKLGSAGRLAKEEWAQLDQQEQKDAANIIDEFVRPHERRSGRSGGYFNRIVMRARCGMSACCYYFLLDVQKKEKVLICPNCDWVFTAANAKQKHCGRPTCLADLNRKNRRASYAKTKTRQAKKSP